MKKYINYIIGCVAGMGLFLYAWLYAVDAAFGKWVNVTSGNIAGWYDAKRSAARSMKSPKIVVIGGSSSLYGVDTNILEQYLEVSALNFGTHAALPLDYIISEARHVLSENDTALLILEYDFYGEKFNTPNRASINYILNRREKFYQKSDFRRRMTIALAAPYSMIETAFFEDEKKINRRFRRSYDRAYAQLDEKGNYTRHSEELRTEANVKRVNSYPPIRYSPVNEGSLKLIKYFERACKKKNIRLLISFPNILDFPEYQTADSMENQRRLVESLEKAGLTVVGKPRDFFFPADSFFDTDYHLTREASIERSLQLCKLLSEFF